LHNLAQLHAVVSALASELLFPGDSYFRGSLDSDHLPHGPGTLFIKDGNERASGHWTHGELYIGPTDKLGRRHGDGKLLRRDLSELRARWTQGLAVDGIISFPNGEKYIGALVGHQAHGQGKLWSSIGSAQYSGSWSGGKMEGLGRYSAEDFTYEGQFQAGYLHGLGTTRELSDKIIHCGLFKEDTFVQSRPVPDFKRLLQDFFSDAGTFESQAFCVSFLVVSSH
jgi:hypothetical protein